MLLALQVVTTTYSEMLVKIQTFPLFLTSLIYDEISAPEIYSRDYELVRLTFYAKSVQLQLNYFLLPH